MLFIVALFGFVSAVILGVYGNGAVRSPAHIGARILAFLASILGIGVLVQGAGSALTLMTIGVVCGSVAMFIHLQMQAFNYR